MRYTYHPDTSEVKQNDLILNFTPENRSYLTSHTQYNEIFSRITSQTSLCAYIKMDSKKPSNDKISKPYFHLYRCKHSNDQKLKDFVKNNKSTLFGAHINID